MVDANLVSYILLACLLSILAAVLVAANWGSKPKVLGSGAIISNILATSLLFPAAAVFVLPVSFGAVLVALFAKDRAKRK